MTRLSDRWPCTVGLLIIVGLLSGCAASHLGIRPDEPQLQMRTGTNVQQDTACNDYQTYSKYAQQLQEAYHSRASMNRGSLYVAGILALAVTAASGGLAAATAVAAGTLALLAVSGGFAAGSFAVVDNKDLAEVYTISANSIDSTLRDSYGLLPPDRWDENSGACGRALRVLRDGVSEARTTLEQARTNVAIAALVRAKEQQRILNDLVAAQPSNVTRVTLSADIAEVSPSTPPDKGKSTSVTLTVANIHLNQVAQADVTVQLGTKVIQIDGPAQRANSDNTYTVKFTAPSDPPDPPKKDYSPVLLVGKAKQAVVSREGKKFTYP